MATALGLGACRSSEGSTEASTTTVSGFAIKGPLDDFRVFIDGNLNGIYDAGEAVAISGTDGAFSLRGPAGHTLHGEVTSTTIDAASGRVIAGHFAAAPAGATVMSPMTTVLTQTALSEAELRQALGLSVDLLSYNPFDAANISTAAARDAEHVAQQLANITRALTGLGQGAGLDARPAFDIASSALNTVLVQHVAQNPKSEMDLWGDATIGAVLSAYRAGLEAAGHSTSVFDALRAEIDSAMDIVNQRILAVGNLTSTEARAVFGLPSDLYAQVKDAATAIANGQANPGLSLDTWAGLERQLAENGFTPPAPPAPAGPAPVLSVNNPTDTFTVQSDIDATLEVTGGGVLANLVGGNAFTLVQQGVVTTGTLFARANGQTSAVSAQTFTLGTAGNDTIDTSGAGNRVDFIFGGDGSDNIDAGAGNDHIAGGDGNDTLDGGAGNDVIRAGDGDDTVIADENDATVRGGNGTDSLTVAANFAPNAINQFAEFERIEITANNLTVNYSGQNFGVGLTIDGGAVLASTITGTSGNDTITGGAGNDTISGSFGDDAIDGGQGDDALSGGAGNDIFTIGSGTDTISDLGTGDVFTVAAGAKVRATVNGAFTATNATENLGGANTDARVTAGIGATGVDMSLASVTNAATGGFHMLVDVIATGSYVGSAGNDIITNTNNMNGVTIIGGAGADDLDGSDGGGTGNPNDVFIIAAAADHAAGEDIDGNAGTDTIRFTSTTANETLTLNAGVTVETIEISDAAGDNTGTTALNVEARNMAASEDVTLIGNDGSNSLIGNDGGNTITGGAGADTIDGGAGADTIDGGAGNDQIAMLVSAGNIDTANGGADTDTLILTGAAAGAVVVDLSVAADADQLMTINGNADALVQSNFENVNAAAMTAGALTITGGATANVIVGTAGNDTITGGAGADTLTGGAGADTFYHNLATDSGDTITDFTVADDDFILTTTGLVDNAGTAVAAQSIVAGSFASIILDGSNTAGSADLSAGVVIIELENLYLHMDFAASTDAQIVSAVENMFASPVWGTGAAYVESPNGEDFLFIVYEWTSQGGTRDAVLIRATGDDVADSFDGELTVEAVLVGVASNALSDANFIA
jgi:Ca2+-binding RTX toxin-like protein